ncbi:DUF6049 family protein [Actinomadura atramentaria]|uniref:DUF6049 family protein n=1 Tax=Actinomadura atramentaria TaxID=1990 RepID=UPI00037AED27|nr:DUF6049 family protein [Actinomadura atramentaria]
MRAAKRTAALLLLLPALLGSAPALAAPPAAAPARDRAQVQIALSYLSPRAEPTGKRSVVQVRGRITNRTGHAVPGLSVRLRYNGSPVGSRGQLDQLAEAQPASLVGTGTPSALPQAAASGGAQDFTLKLDTRAVGMKSFGVYPVGVEAVNAQGQALGGVVSFVTFVTKNASDFKPVNIGWVWPLADRMHRADDRTFLDDRLAGELAAGGRLRGLVDAAEQTSTPVTWAIDPALLDDAAYMRDHEYTVGTSRRQEKPKSKAAKDWLAALQKASAGDQYFALPYADPDAVALVRYRMNKDLSSAYDESAVAAQVLGRQPTARYAWPPAGMAGPATLDQLAKLGKVGGPDSSAADGSFLLSDAMFQDPQGGTPRATTTVQTGAGAKRVVAYDEKLSQIVSADVSEPGAAVLAQQRFLAETAMITAEAPNASRTLVVAPSRHWDPTPSFAKNLLTYTAAAPWLKKQPLDKIAKVAPQERASTGYPDEFERYELGPAYLAQVRSIERRAAAFATIMEPPINVDYRRAVLRAESAAWRGRSGRAKQARDALATELDRGIRKVRVLNKKVSLAGRSGQVLVTVVNELPDQKIRVVLDISSKNSAKLQIGRIDDRDRVIELDAGQKTTKRIPVQAAGNGNFQIHVQLLSADGRKFDDGQDITVRPTGYGRAALVITGGGLAVLVAGVGARAARARRRRKAEAAGDHSAGGPEPRVDGTPEDPTGYAVPPGVPPGALPGTGPSAGPARPAESDAAARDVPPAGLPGRGNGD